MVYSVDLPTYSGPVDLLLYLVKRDELDLSSISLARIAKQFCEHLEVLQELDVDDVGEFIELASILVEMKMRLVLPNDPTASDDEEVAIDVASDELVQRLIQYKRYRDVASILDEQSRRWQLRYARLANDLPSRRVDPSEQPIGDLEIWDLVSAFGRILKENQPFSPPTIIYDDTPIHIHMKRLHLQVKDMGRVELQSLFPIGAHKSTLVAMFLATLELSRHHGVMALQSDSEGAIWLSPGPEFPAELAVDEVDNLSEIKLLNSNMPVRPR